MQHVMIPTIIILSDNYSTRLTVVTWWTKMHFYWQKFFFQQQRNCSLQYETTTVSVSCTKRRRAQRHLHWNSWCPSEETFWRLFWWSAPVPCRRRNVASSLGYQASAHHASRQCNVTHEPASYDTEKTARTYMNKYVVSIYISNVQWWAYLTLLKKTIVLFLYTIWNENCWLSKLTRYKQSFNTERKGIRNESGWCCKT